MREIDAAKISLAVRDLYLSLNCNIGSDIARALEKALDDERSPAGKMVLGQIIENDKIAQSEQVPLCQDCGMAILFVELGQDVHITGGGFEDALNQGVKEAYQLGFFRKSVVSEPVFDRVNTGDNTPAVIHTRIVPGEHIRIKASAKGFGSENMSALKMLTPADGEQGILDFIVDTVDKAGPNPCPPIIVGVGIGGPIEAVTALAKYATLRPVGSHNKDSRYRAMEDKALNAVNKLGIGPGGIGGRITALAVNIEYQSCHIASMPAAVNICCHADRHGECEL
jgi:fumarate hydratase subunit alpha